MKIEELNSYYDSLCNKLKSGNFEAVLNNDRAHNAVIERFMLENSTIINMYCGEMSIFREGFYSYINQDNDVEQCETPVGDLLKRDVIDALKKFVNCPNSKLNIYFERFEQSFLWDLIAPGIFRDGIRTGKIRLFKLDDSLFLKTGIAHTAYTDTNIIRIERNSETHEAICGINISDDIIKLVQSTFVTMASVGEEIEYLN